LLALAPNFSNELGLEPVIYERLGRHQEALAALERLRAASGINPLLRGTPLALMGKREEAQKILADAKEAMKKERVWCNICMASVCFALDDRDQGFAFLDRAYDIRDPDLTWLNILISGPDDLRKDPRYLALVRKIGIPAIGPSGATAP
jgi:hypothetical protein